MNKNAPMKNKFLNASQREFMTKELNDAIMIQSRLRNKYLERIVLTLKSHMINKKITMSISYVGPSINISSITDNRKFWKAVKPFFAGEISHKETENDNFTWRPGSHWHMNDYFNNIVKYLLTKERKVLT